MDKEKLIKGLIWLSVTSLTILLDVSFWWDSGFNNMEHGRSTIFAILILPFVFFCAYKGIKNILAAIFY